MIEIEKELVQCCKQMTNDTNKISELLKKTEGVMPRFERE